MNDSCARRHNYVHHEIANADFVLSVEKQDCLPHLSYTWDVFFGILIDIISDLDVGATAPSRINRNSTIPEPIKIDIIRKRRKKCQSKPGNRRWCG
jgi:hypothetical protein